MDGEDDGPPGVAFGDDALAKELILGGRLCKQQQRSEYSTIEQAKARLRRTRTGGRGGSRNSEIRGTNSDTAEKDIGGAVSLSAC